MDSVCTVLYISNSKMKKIDTNILVVDDQDEVLIAAKMILKRHFENVITLNDPRKIITTIEANQIQIILLDMNFRMGYEDGKEGIYRFKEVQEHFPHVKLILMTSYAQVERAVEGIKLGAIDYILKPWDNDKLIDTIKQCIKQIAKNKPIKQGSLSKHYVGEAKAVQELYKMAARVAKTDANVLILGENGTGKYVLAEYIYLQSIRKDNIFVHVDLGSLNENLFESELFGYAKGAFTDARQDTAGRFEAANGGTIFLDEIGNVPAHLQSKLLQVIQNRTVTRLGESKPRNLDVRIIAATNINLKEAVEKKDFREDLYYRINTISLEIPALRQRKEDLEGMIKFFISYYAEKYAVDNPVIDRSLLDKLLTYSWPGNIRELQNRIERAVILTENESIELYDLGLVETDLMASFASDNKLSDIEKQQIIVSLSTFQNNISKAAEDLGLTRQALYRKMDKYQIKIK